MGDTETNTGDTAGLATDTQDSSTNDCCINAVIRWSRDCAMGHMDPIYVINTCDDIGESDQSLFAVTLPPCPDDGLVDAIDINRLLAMPDLQMALQSDISSYGSSVLPFFRLEVMLAGDDTGTSLFLGDPCDGSESCEPIPPSLAELKALLEEIALNQKQYGRESHEVCIYDI